MPNAAHVRRVNRHLLLRQRRTAEAARPPLLRCAGKGRRAPRGEGRCPPGRARPTAARPPRPGPPRSAARRRAAARGQPCPGHGGRARPRRRDGTVSRRAALGSGGQTGGSPAAAPPSSEGRGRRFRGSRRGGRGPAPPRARARGWGRRRGRGRPRVPGRETQRLPPAAGALPSPRRSEGWRRSGTPRRNCPRRTPPRLRSAGQQVAVAF